MRWSIESRVPFLTHGLAEFVLRLPEDYLVGPDGTSKRLLRSAMRGILPTEIVERRDKIGFEAPEAELIARIADPKEAWLDGLRSLPFIDARLVEQRFNAVIAGRSRHTSQAWRWVTLGRWIGVGQPSLQACQ
jgi:asparagine synthase (glutamine-hydrolysing)